MNRVRDNQEFVIGAVIALIGAAIYFIILPTQLDLIVDDEDSVTPALFPKLASGAIIFLGLIMSISSLLNPKHTSGSKRIGLSWPQKLRIAASIAIIAFYLVLLDLLGFIISTPLFVFGFIWFLGAKKYWLMALLAILLTAVVYFSFGSFVGLPLPRGVIFE